MTIYFKPFCDQSNYYSNYCNFIHEQRNTVILITDFWEFDQGNKVYLLYVNNISDFMECHGTTKKGWY